MGFSSCQHFLQMSIFLLRFQSFRSCFRDKSFFCWSFHCSSNYLMFSRSDTWHTCDESQRCLYWTTVKIDEGFEEKGTTMRKWEKTGKWPVEQFCGIFIDENWEGDERRSTLIRNSLILSDANQTLSSDSLSLFLSLLLSSFPFNLHSFEWDVTDVSTNDIDIYVVVAAAHIWWIKERSDYGDEARRNLATAFQVQGLRVPLRVFRQKAFQVSIKTHRHTAREFNFNSNL